MCSKYNRLLLSTCVQVLALGSFASLPAHAEFKWTPPDEPEYVEDMGADVFVVGDEEPMGAGSALPEYYDTPRAEDSQAIEIEPPIEIKVLEDRVDDEPIEIKTITLTDPAEEPMLEEPAPVEYEPIVVEDVAPAEPVSPTLVLNPYPLENGDVPVEEETALVVEERVEYEVIEGFGKGMPMALALSQIVPPSYAYSFSDGVDPGMRVSWEGGEPWNIVLNNALAPLGVESSIHGKKVVLKTNAPAPMPEMAAAPAEEMQVSYVETPEESMSASLEEDTKKKITDAPEETSSVVLDKTPAEPEDLVEDKTASTMVDDLMQPLDSFEDDKGVMAEESEDLPPSDAPVFQPEIILDEEEQAEEEYAKKLEETHPFEEESAPVELLPLSDTPEMEEPMMEATGEPMSIPLEEEEELMLVDDIEVLEVEPTQASDILDEEPALPFVDEMEEVEPSSHYREVPSNKIRVWQAKRNSNLQKILEEWSARERVHLAWNATEKYVLDYDVFISGTFQNAIDILFKKGLKRAPEYTLSEAPYSISVQEDED